MSLGRLKDLERKLLFACQLCCPWQNYSYHPETQQPRCINTVFSYTSSKLPSSPALMGLFNFIYIVYHQFIATPWSKASYLWQVVEFRSYKVNKYLYFFNWLLFSHYFIKDVRTHLKTDWTLLEWIMFYVTNRSWKHISDCTNRACACPNTGLGDAALQSNVSRTADVVKHEQCPSKSSCLLRLSEVHLWRLLVYFRVSGSPKVRRWRSLWLLKSSMRPPVQKPMWSSWMWVFIWQQFVSVSPVCVDVCVSEL